MAIRDPLLRTRQVAEALHVSGSTIKRWVDSGEMVASRTVGKHRLIPLSEALKFARRQGLPASGLEALAGSLLSTRVIERSAMAIGGLIVELAEVLQRGDASGARVLIRSVVSETGGSVFLADQLIRPVMERLGEHWATGTIDVYHEHQASQILTTILLELNERATRPPAVSAPLALGATPESDPYHLPLLLGELVLRDCGWNVRNLGVNLPLRSLSAAVCEYRPRLVFLSVSHLTDNDRFVREYLDFYETVTSREVAVVLGGRALNQDLRARLVYASCGERMAHLAEFAKRLDPTRVVPGRRMFAGEPDTTSTTQSWNG